MAFFHNSTQIKLHSHIKKKVKANPTEANTLALVKADKALQGEIEQSKQEIEADLIRQFEHSSNNEIHKYISNLTNTRGLPNTMTNGNDTVTGSPEIANCFNTPTLSSPRMTPNHNL